VASGPLSALAGLRTLPSSAIRSMGAGVGFVVLVASLFAGVGAWQDRDAVAAPGPSPAPSPPSAPAPDPAPDPEPDPEPTPGDGQGDANGDGQGDANGDGQGDANGDGSGGDTTPTAPPAQEGPRPADVSIQLLNAAGDGGSAALSTMATTLQEAGFRISARVTAGRRYDQTTIFYTDGFEAEGRLLASVLAVNEVYPMSELPPERQLSSRVMVHVVVGADRVR
jgi:hypothetical protein